MQVDLVDMSPISANNNNIKFLLVAVDVFSRMMFVIPLRNKTAFTVTNAMEEIIKLTKYGNINTVLGSEFISDEFKTLPQKYNVEIQYVDINDHKSVRGDHRWNRRTTWRAHRARKLLCSAH